MIAELVDSPIGQISRIGQGDWSQTFSFSMDGKMHIARFGQYDEDYRKDEFAMRFRSPQLPIPRILQIGEAFDGYYAISEMLPGGPIDDLDADQTRAAIPAVLGLLDALRGADISSTQGYGLWGADGNALFDSWGVYLLDIAREDHNQRFLGWRGKLAESSIGLERFDGLVEKLADLVPFLPQGRWLIHSDLLHYNLLMQDAKVSGLIDWGCAKYGDFLYDLAWFTFWAPWQPSMQGIDWRGQALEHYAAIGLEVPNFEERLQACELHIGLDSVIYCTHIGRMEQAEQVMQQMEG